jgi:asparagine synthase (glutamine-hydrolysing)
VINADVRNCRFYTYQYQWAWGLRHSTNDGVPHAPRAGPAGLPLVARYCARRGQTSDHRPRRRQSAFRTEDGQTIIVYNGEIYNFAELRRELEALGHRFRSQCDTEVALRAFVEWDTACFERFRGMFALAIWSEPEKRLVLARDRMGIKPLYLSRIGRDIVFGSELKAIFAHPKVTRTLDIGALQDYLSLNYVPAPRTLIQGIEKLPPGHYMEWRNGIAAITAYWKLSFAPDENMGPRFFHTDALRLRTGRKTG